MTKSSTTRHENEDEKVCNMVSSLFVVDVVSSELDESSRAWGVSEPGEDCARAEKVHAAGLAIPEVAYRAYWIGARTKTKGIAFV